MFGTLWGREWGASASSSVGAGLSVVAADAIRENMIEVRFSDPVYWSNLRDPYDAADRARYSVSVAGGVGVDGEPPHDVGVARVEQLASDAIGVWLDRALSHYGTRYRISVNGLRSVDWLELDPGASSILVSGSRAGARRGSGASEVVDIGNADLAFGASGSAGYATDSTGDYATESGLAAVRKRCIRRLSTQRGAFSHLPAYGVDIGGAVKRLGSVDALSALAADAEAQLLQEPEVTSAKVSVDLARIAAGLVVFRVRVATTIGSISFAAPVSGVVVD